MAGIFTNVISILIWGGALPGMPRVPTMVCASDEDKTPLFTLTPPITCLNWGYEIACSNTIG